MRYCNNPTGITQNHFLVYFWKTKNTCKRCFWDASEMSRKRHVFWDMLKSLKEVAQRRSFLWCFGDVLKTSQKRHFLRCILGVLKTSEKCHLFWDVSKRSLRCLPQWRSDCNLSETPHAGWKRQSENQIWLVNIM